MEEVIYREDELEKISTGIKNFDLILDGGIPEYSVNIITGPPGGGKTILAQQLVFRNADENHKVLYLTTLSEPAVKLIRYQKNFSFFKLSELNASVIYVDIGSTIRDEGLDRTIESIVNYVKEYSACIVVIDSFKAIHDLAKSIVEVRKFGYDLAVNLSTWECTSFLVGEYTEEEIRNEPIFAITDGIIHLTYDLQGMQRVRYLDVRKMRGGNVFGGKHSFAITSDGIEVYPRIKTPRQPLEYAMSTEKVATGIEGLDRMFEGGMPRSSSTLVAGGAGTGKTLTGLHFICDGIARGEPGLIVTFQENPSQLYHIVKGFGWDFKQMEKEGMLRVLYTSPVELDVDENTSRIKDLVEEIGARRVMIDSLMDLETATPNKVRYKDYIYSVVNWFKSNAITSIMTNEIPELFGPVSLTSYGVSFIADNVIMLRYVEMRAEIKRAICVLKVRGGNHQKSLCEYVIDSNGIKVLGPFKEEYTGVLSGTPTLMRMPVSPRLLENLPAEGYDLIDVLANLPEATMDTLCKSVHLSAAEAGKILDGLVRSGHVLTYEKGGKPYYKVSYKVHSS